MKTENVKKRSRNVKEKETKKFTFKTYIRDFLLFLDKRVIKVTGILVVVAIILIALSLKSAVGVVRAEECAGACRDGVTFISELWSKIQILFVTTLAGIVPYIYAPVVGFIGTLWSEAVNMAYVIKGYGYGLGIIMQILPLLLNILTISITTALGIYICNSITVGYKVSNLNNMNLMNFRIKVYEMLQKEEKANELKAKKEKKIKKLTDKKEKVKWLQVLNTFALVCVIQFVSVLIQEIIL